MSGIATRIFSRRLLGDRRIVGSLCSQSSRNSTKSAIISEDSYQIVQPVGAVTHKNPDYFGVRDLFTVEDLFKARVHYGHVDTNVHESMLPFIFGNRLGHMIFDLDKTAEFLYQALNFTAYIAYNGGIILFVGRTPMLTHKIEETAIECKEYCHTRKWKQGLLIAPVPSFKMEVRLPDLVVLLSTMDGGVDQHPVILEAAKLCIPTVAIVDSNSDRRLITYPIPGNDDSMASVTLYLKLFKQVILRAKAAREEYDKKGDNTTDL